MVNKKSLNFNFFNLLYNFETTIPLLKKIIYTTNIMRG